MIEQISAEGPVNYRVECLAHNLMRLTLDEQRPDGKSFCFMGSVEDFVVLAKAICLQAQVGYVAGRA